MSLIYTTRRKPPCRPPKKKTRLLTRPFAVRDGKEQGFTASEFKTAKAEGWEKQYLYQVGKERLYLPPSVAQKKGFERVNMHPCSTKYGRQNPITARWNSEEQLIAWRAAWADHTNRCLERNGVEDRINHRSHSERGLDEKPTIHEGVSARKMEAAGYISERCEINRQIRADNALIRHLKAAIVKLKKAVETTIPAIANAMETMRQNIIVFNYGLLLIRNQRKDKKEYVEKAKRIYTEYTTLHEQIRGRLEDCSCLQKELDGLSLFSIGRRKDLKTQLEAISEEIEELCFLCFSTRCAKNVTPDDMKNYREKPELAAEVEKRRASGRIKLDTYERRTALKLGMDLSEQVQQAKNLAEENAPKRMRAKETKDYRQMIRSIKTIQEKCTGKYQMLEPKHLMRAVNAILEYQDGKEAELNNRQFANSMHLLGELTAGTAAEKYYRQQLDKVNGIRGLKPGDPGFLKPEDFVSPDPEREKRAKENLPQEKAKEAAQPDAPAKGEPGAPIL